MREILFAVMDRLNEALTFEGLSHDQEQYSELFELHYGGEEYSVTFFGQNIWTTVNDLYPDLDPVDTITNTCLQRVDVLRSALLHLTSKIPHKAWPQ